MLALDGPDRTIDEVGRSPGLLIQRCRQAKERRQVGFGGDSGRRSGTGEDLALPKYQAHHAPSTKEDLMFSCFRIGAIAAVGVLFAAASSATAQMPPPPTPTTKILAIGTLTPGADPQLARRILPSEMRATAQLYLDGKIDQWYSLQGRIGVAFILNVTDAKAAEAMLEALPLGQAHLMTFELTPLGPLNPLRQLLGAPGAQ